jgi:predicted metal-dependent peptidase
MTTFSPEQMMAIARMMTRKYMPYMQAAVMGLIPRETPGLGTMGVTRSGVLMWDPEWISTLPLEQVSGVLLHEANHIIRSHASRAKTMAAEPKIWNVAADCEINDDLSEASVPLPTNGCWPKTFGLKDGLLAETYYHELMQKLDEDGNLKGAPSKPTAAGGMDGSGSGGAPLPGESPEDADGTASEGRSEADLQRIRNQVASAIEAETRTNGEGSVPHGLRIWAAEHLAPPKIRW